MNENQIEGAARDGIGKVKDGLGGLTGDAELQVDGKMDQAAGKVQAKVGEVADQLGGTAKAAVGQVSDFAGQVGSALRDAAGMARRGTGKAGDAICDAGAQAGQFVGRSVQQQPVWSLLGAAAVGYTIAFFLHSAASPLASPARSERRRR
jgi:uncharacterized protein YjbJ (UPF0337 family)